MRLSNLVNIGPKMEELLISAGIHDAEALKELGAVKAAYQVRKKHPESEIRLASLEGALRGTRWHNITEEERSQLEVEYESLMIG